MVQANVMECSGTVLPSLRNSHRLLDKQNAFDAAIKPITELLQKNMKKRPKTDAKAKNDKRDLEITEEICQENLPKILVKKKKEKRIEEKFLTEPVKTMQDSENTLLDGHPAVLGQLLQEAAGVAPPTSSMLCTAANVIDSNRICKPVPSGVTTIVDHNMPSSTIVRPQTMFPQPNILGSSHQQPKLRTVLKPSMVGRIADTIGTTTVIEQDSPTTALTTVYPVICQPKTIGAPIENTAYVYSDSNFIKCHANSGEKLVILQPSNPSTLPK